MSNNSAADIVRFRSYLVHSDHVTSDLQHAFEVNG